MTKNISQDEGQPSPENNLGLAAGHKPLLPSYKSLKAQYEQLYAQYPEDAVNVVKGRIVLFASIIGGPFVYMGLAFGVFYYSEITTWLGLDTFAQYLMQRHAEDYKILAQTKSPEFANSFSHHHATSLLMLFVLCLPTIIGAETFRRIHSLEYRKGIMSIATKGNHAFNSYIANKLAQYIAIVFCFAGFVNLLDVPRLEANHEKFLITSAFVFFVFCMVTLLGTDIYRRFTEPKHRTKSRAQTSWIPWTCLGMLLLALSAFWNLPGVAVMDGRFAIFSVTKSVWGFVAFSSFILVTAFLGIIMYIYILVCDHYWPKFKNLIIKTKNGIS